MTLERTLQYLTLAGILFTATGVTARWLYRGWKKGSATWDSVGTRMETVQQGMLVIQHDLNNITREIKLNGGKSIKDQLNGLVIDVRVIHHESRVSTAARRVAQAKAICEMLVRDGEARCEFVTDEWTRITGLTREGMEDGGWLRAVPIADQPRIKALADAANISNSLFQAEYDASNVVTHASTRVRHIGHPVFDHSEMLVGWVGELTEIE
jgi:hypothetical protein